MIIKCDFSLTFLHQAQKTKQNKTKATYQKEKTQLRQPAYNFLKFGEKLLNCGPNIIHSYKF